MTAGTPSENALLVKGQRGIVRYEAPLLNGSLWNIPEVFLLLNFSIRPLQLTPSEQLSLIAT